jgi:arginine deiminase
MIAPLQRVLVRRPDRSFEQADPRLWHYASAPDLASAIAEHDALVALLRGAATTTARFPAKPTLCSCTTRCWSPIAGRSS